MLIEHLLTSCGAGPPLRIAVLLDGRSIPRPYARVLEHIRRSNFARLALVVNEQHAPATSGAGSAAASSARISGVGAHSSLLFDLYERWDRKRAGRAVERLLGSVALDGVVADVPSLTVLARAVGEAVRFPEEAITQIQDRRIDVAIRFARGRLAADSARIARYGVWSLAARAFNEADEEQYRGGPAHFWELAEGNPVSGVALEVTRAPGVRTMLCRGFAATACEHSDFSLARNRVKPCQLGTTFVIRKLKQLHEHGFDALERDAVPRAPYRGKRPRYGAPSNLEVAAFVASRLMGKARQRLLDRPRLVQWRVAVRVNGSPRFEPGRPFDLAGFRWIDAPRGHLYADPCLVEHRGRAYCFFEDLDHERHVGRISCAAITADGRFEEVRPALELPYHLSYPFVFEDHGDVFMVPESRKNEAVDLFRAVEFPVRWEKVRTLLKGPGLDTTVLHHGGRYWFFVAVREPEEAGEQLLLFHADSLAGELSFHPRNPISTDVRACRSGGAVFSDCGRLLRPSQDGSVTYGHQLNFHEIVALTPDEYREEMVVTVPPPGGMDGIHTYNRCGAIEVIDGKRFEPVARHCGR
jgi:hypothetical protein